MLSRHGLMTSSRLLFSWRHGGRCSCRLKSHFAYPSGMVDYDDDYTSTPEYPPIDPETRQMPARIKRKIQRINDWHEEIKNASTVEEKAMKLNINRRYGWKSTILTDDIFSFKCTPFYSFITKTHFVPDYKLPDVYSDAELTKTAKKIVEKIKEPLLDVLRFELDGIDRAFDPTEQEKVTIVNCTKTTSVVNQVNRLLVSALSDIAPHLRSCQVDYKPNIQSFWLCGGMEPTTRQRARGKYVQMKIPPRDREKRLKYYPHQDDPQEMNFQYVGKPILQLRSVNPISNFAQPGSELCQRGESIPDRFRQLASAYGFSYGDYRFASMIPGYWSGDDHRSSILAIHSQDHLNWTHRQNEHWKQDQSSALDSQAIVTSFSRLLSQAFSYGFDQFSDIDYPFSSQFISTNGLDWSFYAYQLNTIQLDKVKMLKNNRQNICWGTRQMKILEGDQLNEEVVENLVKFYLNPPTRIPVPKENLTPYITEKLNDLEEVRREFIHLNMKDMFVGLYLVPSYAPFPEIYDWERIYKIKFQTMPLEKRVKSWQVPYGFPGNRKQDFKDAWNPYEAKYKLRDPKRTSKALYRYRRILREEKEGRDLIAKQKDQRSKLAEYAGADGVKEQKLEDDDKEFR